MSSTQAQPAAPVQVTATISAAARKFAVKGKIQKESPSAIETQVAQALYDLQISSTQKDLAEELKPLFILAAFSVEVPGGRPATVVLIPYIQRLQFRKIQARLVRELEKKLGRTIVFVAKRRILKKPTKNLPVKLQKRPNSRTVSAVHDAILEDLAYPADIVGKRIRHKLDGSELTKVYLSKQEQSNFENKTQAFSKVYKKLTGKDAVFLFQN